MGTSVSQNDGMSKRPKLTHQLTEKIGSTLHRKSARELAIVRRKCVPKAVAVTQTSMA